MVGFGVGVLAFAVEYVLYAVFFLSGLGSFLSRSRVPPSTSV